MTFTLPNISAQYRCIFVHIPKCAGSSIKEALGMRGKGHPPWTMYAERYPELWKEYLTFTVVRNPWDRVVSAFFYAKMEKSYWHDQAQKPHPDYELLKHMDFRDFCRLMKESRGLLKHESWHPQYLWVCEKTSEEIKTVVNRVLRHEHLERRFQNLGIELGIKGLSLPHVNQSGRGSYRDYYDAETRQIIADLYEVDIKLFRYEF